MKNLSFNIFRKRLEKNYDIKKVFLNYLTRDIMRQSHSGLG